MPEVSEQNEKLVAFVTKTLKMFKAYIEYNQSMALEFKNLQLMGTDFGITLDEFDINSDFQSNQGTLTDQNDFIDNNDFIKQEPLEEVDPHNAICDDQAHEQFSNEGNFLP